MSRIRNKPDSFSLEEWHWALLLGKRTSDPEEEKAFWDALMEKKEKDPKYSIFSDFPKGNEHKTEAQRCAEEIGGEIVAKLKGIKESA